MDRLTLIKEKQVMVSYLEAERMTWLASLSMGDRRGTNASMDILNDLLDDFGDILVVERRWRTQIKTNPTS